MNENDESRMLYLTPEEMRTYHLIRLRETLERARRAPHFAERLRGRSLQRLEDLASLPLTLKEDLRAASPFGSVAVPRSDLFQYHESFGTTGAVVSSWLTRSDFEAYAHQINQCALDFGPNDLLVNKFPYAISVPAHIVKQAAQNRGTCVVSASSLSPACPYTRAVELMRKLNATVLTCLPTEATLLAATARVMGLDPARDFNLRAIGVAGELLTEARRRRLEAAWQCRVYNYYGTTETGNLASDCSEGRMHLAWDHFLCEVVDDHYEPLPPGATGMPVITTLTRHAMPLVRYVLTDMVSLEEGSRCACGRRSPVVHHYGRDLYRFPFQGRRISLGDLEDRMFRLPVDAVGDIWMVIVTPDRVIFRVEAAQPDERVYHEAERSIGEDLDVPLSIEPVEPGGLFPIEALLEPAMKGKPQYYCIVDSADLAPRNLPELWIGPAVATVT